MNTSGKIRVVIADDNNLFRETMRSILTQIGCQVIGQATNGRQAVVLTERLRPDLVLMDIEMPEMNGLQAAQYIQTHFPRPVVVLTAHDTAELAEQASRAGVGAYLIKPPQVSDLHRAIIIAMARFDDMMELRRLNGELETRNRELQEALTRVQTLSGLLPICASCKKIRNDRGYWQQVESYLHEHTAVEFSHGICPDCAKRLYPDFYKDK